MQTVSNKSPEKPQSGGSMSRLLLKLPFPRFYAKAGYFGEYGWKRISFLKWLTLIPEHVTKIKFSKH